MVRWTLLDFGKKKGRLTRAASSRGLNFSSALDLPPSLPPPLVSVSVFLRLSAASRARTLARCGEIVRDTSTQSVTGSKEALASIARALKCIILVLEFSEELVEFLVMGSMHVVCELMRKHVVNGLSV